MSTDTSFSSLLSELMEQWEKCKRYILKLEEEITELKRKKVQRKSSTGLISYLHSTQSAETEWSKSPKQENDSGQDSVFKVLLSIANIHDDLKGRYWLALEQLAEQKLCWNFLAKKRRFLPLQTGSRPDIGDGESLRTTESDSQSHPRSTHKTLKEVMTGTQTSRTEVREIPSPHVRTEVNVSPDSTEIDECPYTTQKPSHGFANTARSFFKPFRTGTFSDRTSRSLSSAKSENSRYCSSTRTIDSPEKYDKWNLGVSKRGKTAMVTESALELPAEAQKTPLSSDECRQNRFMDSQNEVISETDRERYKLKIQALLAQNKDKDDLIAALQTQVKSKDSQINQLAKTLHVSKRIKEWK